MLYARKAPSKVITEIVRKSGSLYLKSDHSLICLSPVSDGIIRLRETLGSDILPSDYDGIPDPPAFEDWDYTASDGVLKLNLKNLTAEINLQTGSLRWLDKDGKILLNEAEKDSRVLERFTVYKTLSGKTEKISTADGEKLVMKESQRIEDGVSFHATLNFRLSEGESVYGFGQHEDGFCDLRGKTVYGHQANRKIAIPFAVSSLGWGILANVGSPFIFSDTDGEARLYFEAVPQIDIYFINGGSMGNAVKGYRQLTGSASMLPRWAFGYWQSQERYETEEEILNISDNYRARGIGLDCVVLDWCSWQDGMWGQKTLDKSRFPTPEKMIKKLHDNHAHFVISIWANSDPGTPDYSEFTEASLMLPGQNVYNALSEEGRKMYWAQLQRQLTDIADGFWCDNSEPFTPEWNRLERPDPARLFGDYISFTENHLPAEKTNLYGYYHALGVYEGLRQNYPEKRVLNLTRSAGAGSQSLGTILWSGDTAASWDTLTKQISAGINFCASGHPYWTTDIGGFFVKNGAEWFWRGDYDGGFEDLGYRELFTRWYQWGAFLPIFRGHGTDFRRELYLCENADIPFYDAIISANKLRYALLPLIYSSAGKCSILGESMIEHPAFYYPDDPTARALKDQYIFCGSMMVCPVHEPYYYGVNSQKLGKDPVRRVYLPETPGGWYDFESGDHYSPGWADIRSPIGKIPVFVKAGAIIPTSEPALSTEEQGDDIILKIFPGADGEYILYEDSGDGCGYEKGEYRLTKFTYIEAAGEINQEIIHGCDGGKYRVKYQKGDKS